MQAQEVGDTKLKKSVVASRRSDIRQFFTLSRLTNLILHASKLAVLTSFNLIFCKEDHVTSYCKDFNCEKLPEWLA